MTVTAFDGGSDGGSDVDLSGMSETGNEIAIARAAWFRYEYVRQRGHIEYCEQARRCDNFYLGGGLQWRKEDRDVLEEEQGRRAIEFNEILDAVNTALGYQIQNRLDISYRPRGSGADTDTASTLSKVVMQVCDDNDYKHHETQVFADGLIQQRGYYELRLNFDRNIRGEISLGTLDPMDVIPDPEGREYDPDTWSDVHITRFQNMDQIEANYGKEARTKIETYYGVTGDTTEMISSIDDVERSTFAAGDDDYSRGDTTLGGRPIGPLFDAVYRDGSMLYVRIIDRQFWKNVVCRIAIYPTGDIRIIEDATEAQIADAVAQGAMLAKRPMRRIRWRVTTQSTVLHDDWSPFKHFSVIPYFPYFRRGRTRGIVDNAIGPQELLNKALSQYLHIVNSLANSGWIIEENSLVGGITTEDLKTEGAKTGLVLEYKKGSTPPQKITANQVPPGIDNLVTMGSAKIRIVMGTNDALTGNSSPNASGLKTQVDQFAAQMSLAVPLDNLSKTRHMLAIRSVEMIQQFMTEPQIIQISHRDAAGKLTSTSMPVNYQQDDGSVLNDLTIGEYAAVVTDQPSQVTFQNSQYEQCMTMIEKGIPIPPDVVLRYSNLSDKDEVAKRIADAPQGTPLEAAKATLANAQASVAQANAQNIAAQTILNKATAAMNQVTALFEAIRTAGLLRADPALAAIADQLAKSAGFVDNDATPPFPANVQAAPVPQGVLPPPNTNLQPDRPDVGHAIGHQAGIRNGAINPGVSA